MHHTVGYLLGNPEDFNICNNCGSFNWYENEACTNCGSTSFRECTQKDVDNYVKARAENGEHFCDECCIDT